MAARCHFAHGKEELRSFTDVKSIQKLLFMLKKNIFY